MKKYILLTGLLLLMPLLQSHEFWIEPNTFKLKKGDVFIADIRVGENYIGEFWKYKKSRILQFSAYNVEEALDLASLANEGDNNHISIPFKREGLQLLVLETNNAFIELEGDKFNAYLIEDGLDDALNYRKEKGLLDTKASEFYARGIKTLVQVGNINDETFSLKTSLPLEITPLHNPYALMGKGEITFQIEYKNTPLPNTLVKVWHKYAGKTTMKEFRTDESGLIRTEIDASGKWMISAVHMVPSVDEKADWQSYWGSFTFGFE